MEERLSNEFIDEINNFGREAVKQDARNYTLKPENQEKLQTLGLNEYGW